MTHVTLAISNAASGDVTVLALAADGTLSTCQTLALGGSLMPMAVSPDRRFLHVARRSDPLTVVTLAIDSTGLLAPVSETPMPASMAYISTDRSGRFLLAASYQADLLTVSAIAGDGQVGSVKQQLSTGPHAHAILAAPSNRHVLATSLGGGVVMQFHWDGVEGILTPNDPPALAMREGAGPRHLRFHPNGRFVYVLNELDATIDVLSFDEHTGTLTQGQTVQTMPPDCDGEPWAADLQLTPNGLYLYSSERRSSTIAGFRIDPQSGALTSVGRWPTEEQPRALAIDAQGHWLLAVGQLSDHLSRYRIDPASGGLERVQRIATGRNPNWIEFLTR